METQSPRTIILDVKGMIKRKNLSVPDVLKLLEEEGEPQSETTIRRLVKDGSEDNDHFNFEMTIKPIADAFYRRFKANDDLAQAQIDLYRHISEYKLELIESLRGQIAHMKEDHEKRCESCEKWRADMQTQIAIKDRRMDEQAQRIDRLLERIDKLVDVLIESK